MKKMIAIVAAVAFTAFSCSGDDDSNCVGATSAAVDALTAFTADENSNENCLALKAALENQRDVCGSLSQVLTDKLASLDCQN